MSDVDSITLLETDPTIFARCPKCTASYNGKHVGEYFAKAYPRKRRGRDTQDVLSDKVCDNCGTQMQFMYEVV